MNYDPKRTLPPADPQHVEMFVSIFRNGATAQNYVGYIKWACVQQGLSSEWYTESVAMAIKGAKKATLRMRGGQVGARLLLTENLVTQIVRLSDVIGPRGFSEAVIVAWEFLLRVQSEAVCLQKGAPQDSDKLSPSRHSGLWVDNSRGLCLRLQRRKHRPNGSFLVRGCSCREVGSTRCPPHRIGPFLTGLEYGQRLWQWSASEWRHLVRRALTQLFVNDAQSFTLKGFRAGKATELARKGLPLGEIMAAGEWKSGAGLRYIDTDAVDMACFTRVLDTSDSD